MHIKKASLPLLIILALFITIPNLGIPGELAVEDETLYIQVAYEMFQKKEWVIPTLNEAVVFNKPPLVYWLMITSFHILTPSAFSARLPITLTGIASMILLLNFSKTIWGNNRGMRPALFFITTMGYYTYSRSSMMDIPLLFLITASLYCVWRSLTEDKSLWLIPAGAVSGISMLIKGPVSILLILPVAIIWLIAGRHGSWCISRHFWIGIICGLILFAIWPIAVILKGYGPIWFNEFLLREHLTKFSREGAKPPLVIIKGALFYLMPWAFLFLAALFKPIKNNLIKLPSSLLLIIWLFFDLLILMWPHLKAPRFAIPLLAPMILLLEGTFPWGKEQTFHKFALNATGIIFIIISLLIIAAVQLLRTIVSPILLLAAAITLGLSGLLFCSKKAAHPLAGSSTNGIIVFALALALTSFILPALKQQSIPPRIDAGILKKEVVSYKMHLTRTYFPVTPAIPIIRSQEEYKKELANGKGILIMKHNLAYLQQLELQPVSISQQWRRWKSRITKDELFQALKTGDTNILLEECYLIFPKILRRKHLP